jgi:hypothetical protein
MVGGRTITDKVSGYRTKPDGSVLQRAKIPAGCAEMPGGIAFAVGAGMNPTYERIDERIVRPVESGLVNGAILHTMQDMAHLSITMDDQIYRRLKREVAPKQISRFIEQAVRSSLRPSLAELEAGYQAAAKETWRAELGQEWDDASFGDWPAS